jgi:hypothetical protein
MTTTMTDNSIRLLAALPVPETTWEPIEPKTKLHHHPRGILRNVSGVFPIVGAASIPGVPAKTATK